MATIKELKDLALHAVRGTAPANFTAETVDDALRGEIAEMCSSINQFQRNKHDIFDIIITDCRTVDGMVRTTIEGLALTHLLLHKGQQLLVALTPKHRTFLPAIGR